MDTDMVQVVIKRGDSGSLTPLPPLKQTAKVTEIFKLVAENLNLPGNYSLIYGTKDLQGCENQTLKECNIVNKATVIVMFKLRGGPGPMQLARAMMQHKTGLKALPGYVSLSEEDCMIMMFPPDEGTRHAKMPCGHVISPQAMTAHALSIVQEGRFQFYCPHVDGRQKTCGREWPFFVVKHVGCFTSEEMKEIEVKLAENYMEKAMGVQRCPGCFSYCQIENKQNPKVTCPVCATVSGACKTGNATFCWYCKKSWKTSGNKDCGNSDCDGIDDRVRYLRNCATTTINGKSCPSVRACPDCGVLINHISGCNNMTCTTTTPNYLFCFICLKKGSCSGGCTPAPVQTFK